MNRSIRRRALLLVVAFAVLAVACSSGSDDNSSSDAASASAGPRDGGTLRVGALGKTSAVVRDPHENIPNESDFIILSLVYEALTVPGEDPVTARLASSWKSDDLKRWRFEIADGATFSDGRPVTADDVVWSLKRLRASKAGSSRLPGVQEAGILKDGDGAVVLVSDTPNAELPLLIRLQSFVMPQGSTDPATAPGSGPYKLESFDDGNAVLVPNEHWHGPKVHLDRIEVKLFEDPTALANAAISGQIDLASNVGAVAARVAEDADGVEVVRRPNDLVIPIVTRVADGPFSDARVRQAMRLGVDRNALVTGALQGFGTVANDILGVGDPNIEKSLPQRKPDLEKAKKLLADAKFDLAKEYPIVATREIPGLVETATLFASQMKEIGIKLKVVEEETGTFYDNTWLKAPLYVTYWGTNDSLAFFLNKTMLSTATQNETGVKDPELDTLINTAVGDPDEAARSRALREVQRYQYDKGGYIVWGMADGVDLVSEKVHGVPKAPGYGRVFLERAWIED